jgi:hypothetical protein
MSIFFHYGMNSGQSCKLEICFLFQREREIEREKQLIICFNLNEPKNRQKEKVKAEIDEGKQKLQNLG